MATVTQTQVAELLYAQNIDNTGGAQYDETLLILDTATFRATMADGSSTPLSAYFGVQTKRAFNDITYTNAPEIFKALLSLQTVSNAGTPALSASIAAGVATIFATIPADYQGSFVWGMTPSIAGGYALPGSGAAGGAGGSTTAASVEDVLTASIPVGDPDVVTFVANPVVDGTPLFAQIAATIVLDSQLGTTTARCSIEQDGGSTLLDITVSVPANVAVPVTLTVVDSAPAIGTGWNLRIENTGADPLFINSANSTQLAAVTPYIAP